MAAVSSLNMAAEIRGPRKTCVGHLTSTLWSSVCLTWTFPTVFHDPIENLTEVRFYILKLKLRGEMGGTITSVAGFSYCTSAASWCLRLPVACWSSSASCLAYSRQAWSKMKGPTSDLSSYPVVPPTVHKIRLELWKSSGKVPDADNVMSRWLPVTSSLYSFMPLLLHFWVGREINSMRILPPWKASCQIWSLTNWVHLPSRHFTCWS